MNKDSLKRGQELLKKIEATREQLKLINLAENYYANSIPVIGYSVEGSKFNRQVINIIPFNEFKARCSAYLENTLSELEIEFENL